MTAGSVLSNVPVLALPQGSCDCQIHVYGDSNRYPVRHENPSYAVPAASLDDALAMHRRVGLDRVVIVQPTLYASDHSLLVDTLNALPNDRARGVALVDDSMSDVELEKLHLAGVRAARFNFQKRLGLVPSIETFRRSVARVRELGWFIKIFTGPTELAAIEAEIDLVDIPVAIDHMGHLKNDKGIDPEGLKRILKILKRDDRWMMLSNGNRASSTGYPWDDVVAAGRAFYEAAPDRCIWGSDWPHIGSLRGGPMPDDADLVALMRRYLPDDAALKQVLVLNPARLFGF